MGAYDICLVELVATGGLNGHHRIKVTEFSALAEVRIRVQGTRKYKLRAYDSFLPDDKKVFAEDSMRLNSELVSEGWRLADEQHANYIGSYISVMLSWAYIRRSTVARPSTLGERLSKLNELVQKGNKDDRQTAALLYTLSQRYLGPLESQGDDAETASDKLFERLERLAELHKKGDLDDAQLNRQKGCWAFNRHPLSSP